MGRDSDHDCLSANAKLPCSICPSLVTHQPSYLARCLGFSQAGGATAAVCAGHNVDCAGCSWKPVGFLLGDNVCWEG